MNNRKIAQELVGLAKDLTAGDAEKLSDVVALLDKTAKAAQKAQKPLSEASDYAWEAYVLMSGMAKVGGSPESETAKIALFKMKTVRDDLGPSLGRVNSALRDIKTLKKSLK